MKDSRPTPGRGRDAATSPHATTGLTTARFAENMEAAPVVAFMKDVAGRYTYANRYLLVIAAHPLGNDWYGKTDAELWPPDVAARVATNDEAVRREGGLQVFWQAMPFGDGTHDMLVMKFPIPTGDGRLDLAGIAVDLTERAASESERDRLAAAIEQSAESVVIADLDGLITYVNPAFERVTGYTREEAIGQNPRILKSGVQSVSFYEAMWAALVAGTPWVADFSNKRKDGTLFSEEAVISPVRDASGSITSYVAVKRDVTNERALEQRSAQLVRERALIAETIRNLRAGDSPEATAQAICHQVNSLTGIVAAHLYVFELDGSAMPIGFVLEGLPDPTLRRIPHGRSRHLHERALEGPWMEPWVNRPWHPYNKLLTELGVKSTGYAPVVYDGRLIGLLVSEASGSAAAAAITETLPALVEFADIAGALIGQAVVDRTEVSAGRERIRTIIERRAFHPVFQPIVDLASGAVVGYEALTRFADEVAPDVRFGEAVGVGAGIDLEIATLRAALSAAERLAQPAWLNVNVSPEFVLAGKQLRTLIRRRHGQIVLEVTEHSAIADYAAFRRAIADLGPRVELAVDDAGSGFASLRHILELRPAFVKLDRSLVAGLDADEARQAMIVGMQHFAHSTGCRLIAEGIETEGERATLRAMDVPLGQGFLLGRPLPAG